ncbi:SRPBCC family protein [Pseudonocardia sp. DLS-67]
MRREWEMYGVGDTVRVKDFEEPERLVLEMGVGGGTIAEFRFVRREEGAVITVVESGFSGPADEAIAYVAGSTGGYTTALCAAKALLEHGVELGAVRDEFPDSWV